jgi:FKBP-type peptidyl-prolyl cis-trans isomerase FklB
MRTRLLLSAAGLLLIAGHVQADDQQSFKNAQEKTSYAVGVDLIRNFKRQGIDADLAAVIVGMQEESAGKKLRLTEPELRKTLNDYQLDLKNRQALIRQQTAERNKKEGTAFLAANKQKKEIVTLSSGLQYKVIKAGNGRKPLDDDSVTCRYRGTLLDGTEFDSSESVGYPVTFYVKDSVIAGWKEAFKLMPAGSKWQIFVPSELAFGEKGAGREIGPNATVVYEIELLAVNPQPVLPKKKD